MRYVRELLRQLRKGLNTRLRAKLVLKGAQLGYCLVFGARDIRLAPAARPTTIAVFDQEMARTHLGRLVAL